MAAHLAQYKFTLKTTPPSQFDPNLTSPIPDKLTFKALEHSEEWERGVVYAKAQNLARTLMELPANMMTPTVRVVVLSSAIIEMIFYSGFHGTCQI